MKKIFLLLLVACMGFSCVKPDDVRIHSFEKFTVKSDSHISIDLKVENQSPVKIKLSDLDAKIKLSGKNFVKIKLKNPVIIKAKSDQIVSVDLSYKLSNPMVLLSLINKKSSYSKLLSQMTLETDLALRAGIVKKKVNLPENSLIQTLNKLGVDDKQLMKSLKL